MAEFELIREIAARVRPRADVPLGIGDDAALLIPPVGHTLAVSCDTLNESVHFSVGDDPAAIGHKAAAVNLSDLAAMGAQPLWCTLGLTLPAPDEVWVCAFLDGFLGLLDRHAVALVGGDTTRGPRALHVTVHGAVPPGQAARREGGRAGDDLWVTGSLGDAAGGLQSLGQGWAAEFLRGRLLRPTPRVEAGLRLRGLARACIDVSDGLLADLGHVLVASGVGADIELAALPTSAALRESVPDDEPRWCLQTAGGDDYELLFSAASDHRDAVVGALAELGTPVTRIGALSASPGLRVRAPDGTAWMPPHLGYAHFDERG